MFAEANAMKRGTVPKEQMVIGPGTFLRFPGNFVCVFPFFPKKKAIHKQI